MPIRLSGVSSRRPRSLPSLLLVGVSLLALVMTFAGDAAAKSKPKPKAKPKAHVAVTVPLPHASPRRLTATAAAKPAPIAVPSAAPASPDDRDDIIGALISDDAASESTATEDSDAPEAAAKLTQSAPPPQTRPVMPPPKGGAPVSGAGLQLALKLLANNDPGAATLAAYALPDRVDIKIVDWLVATGGYTGVPSTTIATLQKKLADWPGQSLMRLRYEQALAREQPPPAVVIKAIGAGVPQSDDGKILLASAYLAVGRSDDAAALIRPFWRGSNFSATTEKTIVTSFGGLLRASDHKARMDRLLYAERSIEGLRAASRLGSDQRALAAAVVLVIKESSKAGAALAALPASVKRDALYIYARIELLRRADKIADAASLLVSAPRDPQVIISPDTWWVERRLVSRALIEKGNPKLAYAIAAAHSAETPALQAEAEFHAGWYALEYLHDPATAKNHFAAIAALSRMPLSVSRAEYWLGRTADAAGDRDSAAVHFQAAAGYPTTFYGQLAVARLGGRSLDIPPLPKPSSDARDRFAGLELVQVIRHLSAAGAGSRADIFYRHLSETLTDPAQVVLLAGMAEDGGNHQLALQIGKTATVRGLPVDALAFPTGAIPSSARTPSVERPVVFAIARQESAFNPGAVSSAGARGLLQLMPSTAKDVAKSVGVVYSKARLTSDPGYNATLGAAHLGDLVDNFGGSYVMTFAAYNAGASRVAQWVKSHGDPRDPKIDVVNWIELIPFTETRNYVQRIMENLQVYRARMGSPTLKIEADLRRGKAN